MASFWKPEVCGQTVLPDRSLFDRTKIGGKRQKLKNSYATFWVIFKHYVLGDQKFEYQNYWPPPKVRLEDSKEEAIMLIGGKHCMKSTCEVNFARNSSGTLVKKTKVLPSNDRTIKFFTQYGFCRMKPAIKLPRMFKDISKKLFNLTILFFENFFSFWRFFFYFFQIANFLIAFYSTILKNSFHFDDVISN